MWNWGKKTENMSRAELELQEAFELIRELKHEMREMKAMVDDALIKAQISHSLIVVRRVSEDKVNRLDELLD